MNPTHARAIEADPDSPDWIPPAPPAVVATRDPLERIRGAAERVRQLQADVDTAESARDDLIREALAAGATWREVAAAAGISKPRVYQIRDRRR